jgi:hypothetical protein
MRILLRSLLVELVTIACKITLSISLEYTISKLSVIVYIELAITINVVAKKRES